MPLTLLLLLLLEPAPWPSFMYFVTMQQLLCRSVDPGLSEQPRPTDLKDIQKDMGFLDGKISKGTTFLGPSFGPRYLFVFVAAFPLTLLCFKETAVLLVDAK